MHNFVILHSAKWFIAQIDALITFHSISLLFTNFRFQNEESGIELSIFLLSAQEFTYILSAQEIYHTLPEEIPSLNPPVPDSHGDM